MSLYLTVVNAAAFVGAAIALIGYRRRRVDRDDVGRALMVCLTALLFLAVAGLARRAQLAIAELAVAAAWTSAAVVAWWAATRRTPDPPRSFPDRRTLVRGHPTFSRRNREG